MYKKAELHLHLDGSLRPETVKELAVDQGIFSEDITLDSVKKHLIADRDNPDLVHYLKKFDLPIEILQDRNSLSRVAFELGEDLSNDSTIYAEVRVAPIQHIKGGLSVDEVVEAILEGLKRAEKLYGITLRLLLCAMRHQTPEQNDFLVELADKFRKDGVVGIDLAGNEGGFPPELFEKFFEKVRSKGIPFTIHAGEARGPESIKTAINMGASRVGHGIRAFEDPEVLKLIKDRDICLECCPISNYNTKAIEDFSNYPIIQYLDMGVSVTLNTDNRTVSDTNYDREVQFLREYLKLSEEQIERMNINAINHAFISDSLKTKLLEEIQGGLNGN